MLKQLQFNVKPNPPIWGDDINLHHIYHGRTNSIFLGKPLNTQCCGACSIYSNYFLQDVLYNFLKDVRYSIYLYHGAVSNGVTSASMGQSIRNWNELHKGVIEFTYTPLIQVMGIRNQGIITVNVLNKEKYEEWK